MKQTIRQKAEHYFDYMVQVRRHLHKNPEVSFKEYDTTEYILHELKKMGIEIETPLETGCIGVIEGGKPGPAIALRADIDALAMEEEGEAKQEFISERSGAAHCCGHDAHTANLLGTAKILNDMKGDIAGKVVLVFQPAEEKLPGGGRMMRDSGILQKHGVEEIYGLHMNPNYKPGQIAVKPGAFMACTVEFEIEVIGKGGHAATPHLTIDPIVLSSQIITQFQSIISRSLDPTEPAIITIGKIQAGSAFNVIPAKAEMIGTVRAFSMETARFIKKRMEEIVKSTTEGAGGSYKFEFNEGYPAVVNDENCTRKLEKAARSILGDENVIKLERPMMAGEDFAFYQEEFPGSFFFLGSGSDEADSKWSWHHPRYNIDEQVFLTGSALLAALVFDR
ncbi:MAG: amidohydrolase [Balneolaceae bacterium]|nr:MAG: amidohydrolase [Balneolaceae bacterium]